MIYNWKYNEESMYLMVISILYYKLKCKIPIIENQCYMILTKNIIGQAYHNLLTSSKTHVLVQFSSLNKNYFAIPINPRRPYQFLWNLGYAMP